MIPHRTFKHIGPSKYKYVSRCERWREGKFIETGWIAVISEYGKYSKQGMGWSKFCIDERQAAIAVDEAFLKVGREPVNILKRK